VYGAAKQNDSEAFPFRADDERCARLATCQFVRASYKAYMFERVAAKRPFFSVNVHNPN
jgi:hypothetical protein